MIKVGIAGGDTLMAGELIRILVNHPDVDIISVCAPGKKGMRVDKAHHGLIGECNLVFSEYLDPENLDVVFIDAHSALADHFRSQELPSDGLHIIDMSHGEVPTADSGTVYALSEINRKKMVHGADRAVVPRSIAAVALLALLPLAEHLMLPSDIRLKVAAPDDITVPAKLEMAAGEVEYWLSRLQTSFSGHVAIDVESRDNSSRGIRVSTSMPVGTDLQLVRDLYETRFEDHTLTYSGDLPMDFKQVEGTDKCLIRLDNTPDGSLSVEAVADCRMRGGAGDAVHAMNLMFGLIETTGLRLKAHVY